MLVDDGFLPPIGPIGADGVDIPEFFMVPSILSAIYIYKGVGNCLVVKNRGRYHVFLAHMEYLGETGWKREATRIPDMKLMLFVSCKQTREHFHAFTSLWYIPFGF